MSRPEFIWSLTEHVCIACLGRVLRRSTPPEYRCSNCGLEGTTVGAAAGSVCACRHRIGNRDAGIRCAANEQVSPENPAEFIARDMG